MVNHINLGTTRFGQLRALQKLIAEHQVCLGGNNKLKIYGKLNCRAGMRMKTENRVFFTAELEAIKADYRPCGLCMRHEYQIWKQQNENR